VAWTSTEKLSEFLQISGICNWKLLVPVIALANGLVLLVQFRALHPVHHLTCIVGAIAACWMLGSIAFCCRLLGTSSRSTKGFRLHFARPICVCFLLLVLCIFYLILRLIGGTLAGASQSLLAPAPAFSDIFHILLTTLHVCFQINSLYGAELKCLFLSAM
jgi:hypothetical protein